jgi:hypothetical protein
LALQRVRGRGPRSFVVESHPRSFYTAVT